VGKNGKRSWEMELEGESRWGNRRDHGSWKSGVRMIPYSEVSFGRMGSSLGSLGRISEGNIVQK
jgi:hypothetical protein